MEEYSKTLDEILVTLTECNQREDDKFAILRNLVKENVLDEKKKGLILLENFINFCRGFAYNVKTHNLESFFPLLKKLGLI